MPLTVDFNVCVGINFTPYYYQGDTVSYVLIRSLITRGVIHKKLKSSSINTKLGGQMTEEKTDRAERDRKDRVKQSKKKLKDRVKKARKVQEKAEKAEKDRVESVRQNERARIFHDFLSDAGSKGCCEPCNYYVKKTNGEPQRCKMGHKDSGPDKEICVDCSDQRYRPKK